MLKKILLAVAVAAPMFMSAQAVKFGVINPQEIVNVMPDYATAQSDLQKPQETLMAPIEQKLNNAIQSVGAKGGYTAIFMEGALMYKGSNLEDVSAKVKAELGIK